MIYGSVFEGFRKFMAKFGTSGYSLHKLFTCFLCLGTWMGFAISAIMTYFGFPHLTPMGAFGVTNIGLMIFMNGLLSTAGVWIIHQLVESLERSNPED
jgi:hypothetical protein